MTQPKVVKMFPPTNDRAQLQRDVEAWLAEHPEYTPEHFRIDIVRSETGGGYIVYIYSEPLETAEVTPLPEERGRGPIWLLCGINAVAMETMVM